MNAPGSPNRRRDIVVMTGSEGALNPIITIVASLPSEFQAATFIVLHTGANVSLLPQLLSRVTRLPVGHASDGERISFGRVYVPPADRHMRIFPDRIGIDQGPKVHYTRPAADPLFESAAVTYGARVVGVVLSGGDSDGAAGLRKIHQHGGVAIVQDPAEALRPSMPHMAEDEDTPHYILRAHEIGPRLVWLASRRGDWLDERRSTG